MCRTMDIAKHQLDGIINILKNLIIQIEVYTITVTNNQKVDSFRRIKCEKYIIIEAAKDLNISATPANMSYKKHT